jgi:hypothetical protein
MQFHIFEAARSKGRILKNTSMTNESRPFRRLGLLVSRRISIARAVFALQHREVVAVLLRNGTGMIFVCPESDAMAFGEPTKASPLLKGKP